MLFTSKEEKLNPRSFLIYITFVAVLLVNGWFEELGMFISVFNVLSVISLLANKSFYKKFLAGIGLIEGSLKNPKYGDSPFEPFKVPNPPKFVSSLGSLLESIQELEWSDGDEEDTSNTFSTTELNIVIDYLKTQISRIVLSELDSENFIRQTELKTAKDLFINEIKKVQSLKKMTVKDRQKVCKRV
jgi:hypothetical protein